MPGRSTNLDSGRARAYCELAVGAGGDCSDIFFLSRIISLFFSLPLSGMDGWVTCGLSPFQQNYSDIRTLGG